MSCPYSQESAGLTSDSSEPECQSSGNASQTPSAEPSSPATGPESPAPRMSPRFYDPSRTLMPDGSSMANWNEHRTANALTQSSGGGTKAPLILSAVDFHAKTYQSQENERGLPVNDQDCSSRPHESQTLFSATQDGSSLRTYPDSFPAMEELTSGSYSRRWPTSGFTTSLGELWTADTSECPSGGGEYSSLPDVLEATVPERFYLSPKAAAGILRRAAKRGRELPPHLAKALRTLASAHPDDAKRTT